MKKYKIELSEEQMRLVADCLEDISRFASGQSELRYTIDEMMKELPHEEQMKRSDEVDNILKQAKRVLLPSLHDNASIRYNGTDFIGNTYQIYRTILYQLAKDNNWNNVYSYPALPSGNMGTIKIEQV
jgi:carbonic anhydrase